MTLAELRLKLEGMVKEERILRRTIAHVSEILKHFQHDFYELAQLIQVIVQSHLSCIFRSKMSSILVRIQHKHILYKHILT